MAKNVAGRDLKISTPPQCTSMPNCMIIDLKIRKIAQFVFNNIQDKNELLAIRPKI